MSRGRKSKKNNLLTALKQAILQQAIQGKLTADWRAENPDAEPASELLKRIKAEKQKLIDEKKIRKEKPLPVISAEEIPFDLPDGWVWCRVGQLGVINRGKSPKYDNEGKNIILNQKCVRWFHVETQHCKTISLDWYETFPDEIKTAVNDILINSTGEGTIGRSAIVDKNSAGLLFDSHVLRFRTSIESPYIMTLINSDFGQNQINDLKGAKSTKQTELGVNNLSNMIFPLAPMSEQTAIVQKVEALMQKCDALEKGESIQHYPAIDKQADQLLNRYAVGRQLLAELPQQQTQVKQLKQAILQEAIQGKLTADWRAENPDAEPASELLTRIKAEKQKLIDEKKIRKEKPLPAISAEEIPFDLPDGWVWCRLGEIIDVLSGNNFQSTDFVKNNGVKCIKITNAGVGNIIESDERLPYEFIKKYKKYLVFSGDIVLALTRPYISSGLKVSVCPAAYNKSLLNQRVAVIRPWTSSLYKIYCYLYMRSDFVLSGYKVEFETKGQQPNLKKEHITHLFFPLPPLPEQTAIVQKVETLMQTCTDLEAQIKQSETHATQLMQAVIKEAFEPEKASATP